MPCSKVLTKLCQALHAMNGIGLQQRCFYMLQRSTCAMSGDAQTSGVITKIGGLLAFGIDDEGTCCCLAPKIQAHQLQFETATADALHCYHRHYDQIYRQRCLPAWALHCQRCIMAVPADVLNVHTWQWLQGAKITGTDWTDVVMGKYMQKQLCGIADGTNPVTGVDTKESLFCP